ncbi:MAG: YbbR-like domain-containing protein [Calditrichaceae bacterium]|nr:YbbR-like domain-containing protein [Calditrichaceae bacterium]
MNKLIIFIKENYRPLLVAFGLALLLWLVVATDREYKTRIEVPFRVLRLAEDKVLIKPIPDKVIMEVSGKGRALIGLNFYNTKIDLELPEVNKSTIIDLNNYISRFDVGTELGINVVDIIEPKQLDLRVDRFAEAEKPLRVQVNIQPAPGYTLNDVILEQDSISVSGPASLIDRLNYLETEIIEEKDVKYPFRKSIPIVQPRPGIIQLNPENVTVSFDIEQIVERTIYDIPIQIVGVPANLTAYATPRIISLRIKGSESLITHITKDEITVFFDYEKNYQKGISDYNVQIETPKNVSWTNASPEKFRLSLKRVESN